MMIYLFSRDVDRNIDELTILKHEKLEIEKRLRRLKLEKSNNNNNNNVKKPTTLTREKDVNSSDNESPDESDGGMLKFFNRKFIFSNLI